MTHRLHVQVAAFVLAVFASSPAFPQNAEPAPAEGAAAPAAAPAPAPWGSFCGGEGRRAEALQCQIEQRVVMSNSGQLLTGVTISLPADVMQRVMTVQTPFGLFLPAGIRLAVDQAELATLPLRTCDASGCYADTPVTAELLSALQRGNTLTVTFQDARKADIAVPVSLLGFTAALERAR